MTGRVLHKRVSKKHVEALYAEPQPATSPPCLGYRMAALGMRYEHAPCPVCGSLEFVDLFGRVGHHLRSEA